jgi:cell division protein DivIC
MKKFLHVLKAVVKNYFIMTGLIFLVWMVFFDSNNVFTQMSNMRVLKDLLKRQHYYESEIKYNKGMVRQLTNLKDLRPIEKYARENYLMKRANEDIFLIIREEK